MNREAQEKYLSLNHRIMAENDRNGFVPPCRKRPELFFPEDFFEPSEKASVEAWAKKLCGSCLFENECLDYALTSKETAGIWGGLTTRERSNLLRR